MTGRIVVVDSDGTEFSNRIVDGVPLFNLLAHHEAGHAIAWIRLTKLPLEYVRIAPRPRTQPVGKPSLRTGALAKVLLAGLTAEILLRTKLQGNFDAVHGACGSDNSDLERFESLLMPAEEKRQAFEATMELLAKDWRNVEDVARSLLSNGELTGSELTRLVGN